MKVLYIAPLPPPVSGHSLAAKVLYDELVKDHNVEVVNLRKESLKEGNITFGRILQMLNLFKEIYQKKKNAEVIYLTISESLAGNLRDILMYLLCLRRLPEMVIHLHGGSIGKLLFDKHKFLKKINEFFISRMGGVIVLGQSHVNIFSDFVSKEKIHIVPNFAEDYLFVDKAFIDSKFENKRPLRILYLSNLTRQKGYNELVDAFLSLDESLKKHVQIDFAGMFASQADRIEFLEKIKGQEQIRYHGVVHGLEKKDLLSNAHVFCLPTSLSEGQPISILEAYAAGCVVVTTHQGGIVDIFDDLVNGYLVQHKNVSSIRLVIERLLQHPDCLHSFASRNKDVADANFKTAKYCTSIKGIFSNVRKMAP